MSANERLIFKMSLGQKIKLITSTEVYKSSPVGGYEFPVFNLTENPLVGMDGAYATQFPSDRALANSFNPALVSEVYSLAAKEAGAYSAYGAYNVQDSSEKVATDGYLKGSFYAAKIRGVQNGGGYACLERTGEGDINDRLVREVCLSGVKPSLLMFRSIKELEEYNGSHKPSGIALGVASECREVAGYLFGGCSYVFLTRDFTEELIDYFTHLTENYKQSYADYRAGSISLAELDRRAAALEVLDEKIIDIACDKIISLLAAMRAREGKTYSDAALINGGHKPLFNEVLHSKTAFNAAKQSAVLVKNDGVLPLSRAVKVALIGGAALDGSYAAGDFENTPTSFSLPADVLEGYGINVSGSAAGYGKSSGEDLRAAARAVCADAGCALVYLYAGKGEKGLPQDRYDLLSTLSESGVKVVAVVDCEGELNLDFAEGCAAVILTYRGGQECAPAVASILSGESDACGRLANEILSSDGEVKYPLGYGLSFTKFSYRNLTVNDRGISFTVTNTGSADGYAVPQLYVRKGDSSSVLKEKSLRGFTKVFIKAGDSVRAGIAFDENTFSVFDEKTGLRVTEGGKYDVYVSENKNKDCLSGSLTLAAYEYKEDFASEVIGRTERGGAEKIAFTDSLRQKEKAADAAKKKLSFGLKLFIAIVFAVYFNGVFAALAFTDIVPFKDLIFYIVVGALALIFDVIFIVYVVIIAKNRKLQKRLPVNDVLTGLVDSVKEFDEIAKVTYLSPVEEEEKPAAAEELDAVRTEEEEPVYDSEFSYDGAENVAVERLSFGELCRSFKNYAQSLGVGVEISSARQLISAICSSKAVILTTPAPELMPDFLKALNGFFGNESITVADGNWSEENDLLWRRNGEKYVVSDFVNTVYSAQGSPDKVCVAIIDNVDPVKAMGWFGRFIDYANHPTEEHVLPLGGAELTLPDNITYILVPSALEGVGRFSRALTNATLRVDVVLSKAEGAAEETEVRNISRPAVCEEERIAREGYFLPEKVWKKLDELTSVLSAGERFSVGNKNMLQLEKFTSIILNCGGDEAEALSSMFTAKIVPLLKLTAAYSKDDGEATLSGIIEKLFPEEELTKIKRALVKNA